MASPLHSFSLNSSSSECSHSSRSHSKIAFESDNQNGLSVTIRTKRLIIQSVQPKKKEYKRHAVLFGDKTVMKQFGLGKIKAKEQIRKKIESVWAKRWESNDPFSAMSIFLQKTDEFLGHIILDHGDKPGESELSFVLHRKYWEKGFGTEAVQAVVKEYAPAIVQKGYTIKGHPFTKVSAITRLDNLAALRILEKVGMRFDKAQMEDGILKYHYSIDVQGMSSMSKKA